ncbi:hypothetical protein CROQUDRAFT_660602 [Cronartium quercuum f. sp. fusiforme G11]|uniref:T-cell immunomodulatory protein TIP C2 domain-containing protein n=1 Tax=Cronartium quercuum f. sp. fusiforme G11 TaxID=708437 RepID=A0A9P6NE33_9BASI|nr:hypothetical protein CROQUDRAFT_660602 [Cronartium quercuum f. sp. fusiforme G11]
MEFMTYLRISLFLIVNSSPSAVFGFDFYRKKFKSEGLIEYDRLGLNLPHGSIIGMGDSNADQFQDLFILSEDQLSINLYLWNRDRFEFTPVQNNPIISHSSSQFIITNVILTDLNHDGRLDVLLMGFKNPSGSWNKELMMEICYGIDGQTFSSGVHIPSSLSSHPLAIDSQGSMNIDLLGLPSSLPSVFKLWRNNHGHHQNSGLNDTNPPFELVDIPFRGQLDCKLPNPHSSAFIDLDGDCLADIFLTCEGSSSQQTYQIWTNSKSQGFTLAREGALPKATKQITFADVDRDGTIDMIFATCPTTDQCSIHVAYNQQIPLCDNASPSTYGECRDHQTLCTADPNFKFSFEPGQSTFSSFSISKLFPGYNLVTSLSAKDFIGTSPVSIQTGDFDLDGFPDLLLLITPHGSDSGSSATPRLLKSLACTISSCTEQEIKDHRRRFIASDEKLVKSLNSITDAKSAFFMDIDEDGTLDLVVQRAAVGGQPGARSVTFLKNNFFNDAFFLKAMVLNGACSTWCPARDGQPEYRPYGVNYPGGSYKFTIQDTYGTRRATAVAQMGFQAYPSPITPYAFVGLGRTNNYIEKLFVGTTIHGPEHVLALEGLLPNSQLVVIPYGNAPRLWSRQLYLHPGDWIPWVTATLAIATAILAVIVGVLHVNEKREDERERRRKAHTINFDAL